jgi:hypothetical protein
MRAAPLRCAALRLASSAPPPRARLPASARRALSAASAAALPPSPPLSADELRSAARSARLCDHIYADDEVATAALVAADGLRVVAQGRSAATRWFVADDAERGVRHVVFRGVAWRDEDVNRTVLAARLAQAWPAALERGVPLRAHAGVAALAEVLWPDVAPHLAPAARPRGAKLALAGHSLGGSLALLTAALARLRLGTPPASLLPIHAFGSPPVLTLERDGAPPAARAAPPGAGVLQLLQLPPRAVRLFVLDTDPVPRMWSAADPLLAALRARLPRWAGGDGDPEPVAASGAASALDATTAQQPLVAAASSPVGGIFEAVGDVYWVRWEGLSARCERLAPEAVAAALATPAEALLSPLAILRANLDHNRRAYTAALEALLALADASER